MSDADKQKKKNDMERMKIYVRYSGLGFQVVAIIVLGALLGERLDGKMENEYAAIRWGLTLVPVMLSRYYLNKKVRSGK